MPRKDQVNLYLETDVDRRLEEISRRTRRSKGAMVAMLVDRAYDRMKRHDRARRAIAMRIRRPVESLENNPEVS